MAEKSVSEAEPQTASKAKMALKLLWTGLAGAALGVALAIARPYRPRRTRAGAMSHVELYDIPLGIAIGLPSCIPSWLSSMCVRPRGWPGFAKS